MNRRDAIKAAVAGVATCALPAVAQTPDLGGWVVPSEYVPALEQLTKRGVVRGPRVAIRPITGSPLHPNWRTRKSLARLKSRWRAKGVNA
jgi:hypothetical protein